jgi:SAM-dependent methyltransferase
MSEYGWSEEDAASRRRLAAIAAEMDRGSFERLTALGVGPGWKCAEIGAGAGTVARWLSEQVGSSGHVLATDLETRWLADLPSLGVEVQRQDITLEAPDEGVFDLVHARAVLTWLPEGERAIGHMVSALRPGGWILLEDGDLGSPFGRTSPEEPAVKRFTEGMRLMIDKVGGDPEFGRRLPTVIRHFGLVDIGTHARLLHASAEVMLSNLEAGGDIVVSYGVMQSVEVDTARAFFEDPANLTYGLVVVAAWGRKPL